MPISYFLSSGWVKLTARTRLKQTAGTALESPLPHRPAMAQQYMRFVIFSTFFTANRR
jgi:hypothetical protein